ncbi:MAG TPA: aminodeoxychorismate synthase component I, partial [Pasteurellaceae bacterium]|nr:aminodeoxychorismate synthase component I [Pasteurellaceae bacterium]
MPFHQFIQQANQLGKERIPFFFLIDFEQQKPIILPLSQAAGQGIYFSIADRQNLSQSFES